MSTHTCLLREPREMVQTGLLELVGRSVTQIGPAIRQHARVLWDIVTMCNRSLKQSAIRLSSCEAEFCAASACAGELLGFAELSKELHYNVSVRLEMDSDSARHILQRRRPGGLLHVEIRCLAIRQWIREKVSVGGSSGHERQYCRSHHETSAWTENAVARKETWTSNPGRYEW